MQPVNMIAMVFIGITKLTIFTTKGLKTEIQAGTESLVLPFLETYIQAQVGQEEDFVKTVTQLCVMRGLRGTQITDPQ